MADQQDVAARAVPAFNLCMNLGDQRANRVDYPQRAALCGQSDRTGTAMGGQDRDSAFRHFIDFLNEDRTQTFQAGHNRLVVDNCPAHEYRCAVQFQRLLNRVDRPLDPGAEPARIGEQNASFTRCLGDRIRADRRFSHGSPQVLHSLAAKERTTAVPWDRLLGKPGRVSEWV